MVGVFLATPPRHSCCWPSSTDRLFLALSPRLSCFPGKGVGVSIYGYMKSVYCFVHITAWLNCGRYPDDALDGSCAFCGVLATTICIIYALSSRLGLRAYRYAGASAL